jgi:hypothetical protein
MRKPRAVSDQTVLADQAHSADIWNAHEVAHWQPSRWTDEEGTGIKGAPFSVDDREPADSIRASNDELAKVSAKDGKVDATSDELMQTRGAANFSVWRQTRRQLDGEGATFVVEVKGRDGNPLRVDLMNIKFSDLPASIRAEFEHRKFPDLTAFTLVRDPNEEIQSGPVEVLESENPASRSDHDVRSRRLPTTPVSNRSGSPDSAVAKDVEDAGATPPYRYERARPSPVQTSPGFGISLGGLVSGARQAMQGVGRASGNAGRSAASTLATLRETLGATSGRQRERFTQRVRKWREARASEALESLAKAQAQFETTLRIVREDPDLRSYFRSWDARSTAPARRRAIQRFREAITARRIGEATVEKIESLFQQAEVVRSNAVRAVRRVNRAAHGADSIQRSLAAWLRRTSKQAGPLTSVAGESLAEKLAQMADAIGKALEKLADRIARLTSARPS